MIDFKKKIKGCDGSLYAKHYKIGTVAYDMEAKRWEVFQDIHFDKFWAREVK